MPPVTLEPSLAEVLEREADLAEAVNLSAPCVPIAIESSNLSFPNSVLADITKSHVKLWRSYSVGIESVAFFCAVVA